MVQFRLYDELSWIFVGDELQGQLPGHWRGVKTKNNLWKSDLLPPAMIELTVKLRSADPVLNAFWKRAREESSPLLSLTQFTKNMNM